MNNRPLIVDDRGMGPPLLSSFPFFCFEGINNGLGIRACLRNGVCGQVRRTYQQESRKDLQLRLFLEDRSPLHFSSSSLFFL